MSQNIETLLKTTRTIAVVGLSEIVEESVQRKCGFFWAQQGVYHQKAVQILQQANSPFIMDSSVFVEHKAL